VTCTQNFVNFGRVDFEIYASGQTDRHEGGNTGVPPGDEVTRTAKSDVLAAPTDVTESGRNEFLVSERGVDRRHLADVRRSVVVYRLSTQQTDPRSMDKP